MASDSVAQNPVFRITTFHPTKEEFKDFSRYIAYMESQGAHRAGLAKIIPPKDWKARRTYDDIDDLVIPAPIQQVVTGQSGLFTQYNIQKKPMSVREFRKVSNTDKFCNPRYVDFDELERKYWKNLTFNPPLYGADVSGTLYDADVSEWNVGRLNTILDTVERESGVKNKGVNTPCLYFGMWKSTFAWHTEDMDLYSINYLHFGEPKSWYIVPPEHGKRLERLAKGFFPGSAQSCEAFLRHKMTLISPSILRKYGIPFEKVIQEAGQFIVTFPYAYHAGFNHGFNCAESTNFATQRWIDYGKQAALCSCRKDMVKIPMDLFVRKFQPERYKLWKAGKDSAPIDHSKPTPEAEKMSEESGEVEKKEEMKSEESGGVQKKEEMSGEVEKKEEMKSEESGEVQKTEEMKSEKSGEVQKKEEMKSEESGEVEKKEEMKNEESGEVEKKEEMKSEESGEVEKKEEMKSEESGGVQKKEEMSGEVEKKEEMKSEESGEVQKTEEMKSEESGEVQKKEEMKSEESGGTERIKGDEGEKKSEDSGGVEEKEGAKENENLVEMENKENEKTERETEAIEMETDGETDSNKVESEKTEAERKEMEPEKQEMDEQTVKGETNSREMDTDWLEGESWAKPLAQLWQNRPYNEEREREYNREMGLQPPYCAVCMLFQTYQRTEGGNIEVVQAGGQMRTKPLIPEMCFSTTTEENAELRLSTPHLELDGTSLLISCSQCCVRVHSSEYHSCLLKHCLYLLDAMNALISSRHPKKPISGWVCGFCFESFRWVHVLCAVAVLEARFVNIAERSPVDLSGIPLQRFKLKCYYCKRRMKKPSGCCVQCSHGRCPTSYHPTCAQAAGVLMHPDDWPFIVYVTCCRHKGPRNKEAMRELNVGQKVICKHKNGRYYQCDVVQLSKETFYEVNFDDGSFSDNLFPEDIVSRDCSQLGPPPSGEVVQVRWTDGLIYGAKFVAAHVTQMYQVEFEDGSQLTAKRDDVYTLDEELPKRVKSRLSKASDMRFDGIFGEKKVQDSKRQRVINSRYRGDYIEPHFCISGVVLFLSFLPTYLLDGAL
uniref:[histone H3]-trimethyl-L-lysine(9) demethylase n=1 Tax=Pygocentrus nattereri TaxID=42514 RepID=A0AAR2JL12_PYGNA